MQEVTMKIFASLLHWAKEPEVRIPLEGPTALRNLVERLGIPEEEVAVVIRNGKQVKLDAEVIPGDTVALFPVIDGG